MADSSIAKFLKSLSKTYGNRVKPYGTNLGEEHGTAFRIEGVDATFSVLTLDGSLPHERYDVQIESFPPGDYLLTAEYGTRELFSVIERIVDGERPVV